MSQSLTQRLPLGLCLITADSRYSLGALRRLTARGLYSVVISYANDLQTAEVRRVDGVRICRVHRVSQCCRPAAWKTADHTDPSNVISTPVPSTIRRECFSTRRGV